MGKPSLGGTVLGDEMLAAFTKRQGGLCYYCHRETHRENRDCGRFATLDHVRPVSRGGLYTDWHNIALACKLCNDSKGDMMEDEFRTFVRNTWRLPTARERLQIAIDRGYALSVRNAIKQPLTLQS